MMNKEQLEAIKERVKNSQTSNYLRSLVIEKDVPALIAEVERLQQFEQKAIYVIEENKRLREALEFYADKENWKQTYQGSDIVAQGQLVDYWEPSPIEFDNKGDIARQTLGDGDE